MQRTSGGYDSGYRAVPCFWGVRPGSLVEAFVAQNNFSAGYRVLDLGCGEGKNAAALAKLGCVVDAVDCSPFALRNGSKAFPDSRINWIEADIARIDFGSEVYDLIIAYGLFHCLQSPEEISQAIERAKSATKGGGHHIICTFNDRSQDLSAHPDLRPTLLGHAWYVERYKNWESLAATDTNLVETHPHNNIEHHHSLTRILARKPMT